MRNSEQNEVRLLAGLLAIICATWTELLITVGLSDTR